MTMTSGHHECFQRVRRARLSNPVNTDELENIRDFYGYDLYIECLREVLKINAFAEENGLSFVGAQRMMDEIENDIDTEAPFESLRS
jgi:hypothetical protein